MKQGRWVVVVLSLLFYSSHLYAQPAYSPPYFPLSIGDSWNYSLLQPTCDYAAKAVTVTVVDTVNIGGMRYFECINSGGSAPYYMRVSGSRVFGKSDTQAAEQLTYDFSANVGDTILTYNAAPNDTVDRVLTNLSTQWVLGRSLRVWEFSDLARTPADSNLDAKYIVGDSVGLLKQIPSSSVFRSVTPESLYAATIDQRRVGWQLDLDTLADVFPLAVGNSWTYAFTYDNDQWSSTDTRDSGAAVFTVTGKAESGDTTVWTFSERRTYREVVTGSSYADTSHYDTTLVRTLEELGGWNHPLLLFEGGATLWSTLASFCYPCEPESSVVSRFYYVGHSRTVTVAYGDPCIEDAGDGYSYTFKAGVGMTDVTVFSYANDAAHHAARRTQQDGYEEELDLHLAGPPTILGVKTPRMVVPVKYSLAQNYPNPFNPTTTIHYELPTAAFVTLKVYNILGEEVASLVNEHKAPGAHESTWNSANIASGVYFYRLTAGLFSEVKKMVLVR